MGQEPNIPLRMEDLPRPTPQPDPARRWSPDRPGELHGPDDVPWGGMFGTPGPDAGYVLRLIHHADLELAPGEDAHDAEVALAAVAAARASHFGRAPVGHDVEVARLVLGYAGDLPDAVRAAFAADRPAWIANLSHRPARERQLVAAVPVDLLTASVDDVRRRVAGGERLSL